MIIIIYDCDFKIGYFLDTIHKCVINFYFDFLNSIHLSFHCQYFQTVSINHITLQFENQSSSLSIAFLFVSECQSATDFLTQSRYKLNFIFVDRTRLNSNIITFFNEILTSFIFDPIVNHSIRIINQFNLFLNFLHQSTLEHYWTPFRLVMRKSVIKLTNE